NLIHVSVSTLCIKKLKLSNFNLVLKNPAIAGFFIA
ncbi:MAG: hypothetical protein ACI9N3_001935, partial [Colwellia sp.]